MHKVPEGQEAWQSAVIGVTSHTALTSARCCDPSVNNENYPAHCHAFGLDWANSCKSCGRTAETAIQILKTKIMRELALSGEVNTCSNLLTCVATPIMYMHGMNSW